MERELKLLKKELKLEKLLNGLKELKLSAVDGLIAQFEQASEDDNGI